MASTECPKGHEDAKYPKQLGNVAVLEESQGVVAEMQIVRKSAIDEHICFASQDAYVIAYNDCGANPVGTRMR
jgi:hypothetical protein